MQELIIIGGEEWCAFESFNIPAILARVDSGAKTSSIQATDIELFKKDDEDWVRFTVNPLKKNTLIKAECIAQVTDKRSIKGSFGISEERLIIKVPITIGEETFDIELSLANRNTMEFRMLLGREAMSQRFLINPAKKLVLKTYLRKELKALYKTFSE